ncbi:MAG: hypothetical protein M0R33_09655 [Methylomonas sp.]|jgi:flagellar biosynthesis/type III secretory pathway protein FliH|uniref:hypothetical protein n=1 Tax=Methylomonas sp. TaxID=418 RepID=UPI0025F2A451|nr:hypothetical protein [Methylomonas sp.]MCK9606696.1 hypothetical protein [Methylomonas sp.]
MRKSKFGEKTVLVRVPESKVDEVRNFLKKFEVIDQSLKQALEGQNQASEYWQGYRKGFTDGFERGEEFQFCQSFAFVHDDEGLALALDLFNKRIPSSIEAEALGKYVQKVLALPENMDERVVKLKQLFLVQPSGGEFVQLAKDNN